MQVWTRSVRDIIRSPDYSSGENLSYNHWSASPRPVASLLWSPLCERNCNFFFLFTVTLILQMKADSNRGVTYIAVYNYWPLQLYTATLFVTSSSGERRDSVVYEPSCCCINYSMLICKYLERMLFVPNYIRCTWTCWHSWVLNKKRLDCKYCAFSDILLPLLWR